MNAVYRYLLFNEHFKNKPVSRLRVCHDIGITEREFRYQTAEIQAEAAYKINFNTSGVYLCGLEEIQQLRTRAINAIKREVVKIKEYDRILNNEGQTTITEDLEIVVKRYGG